MIKKLTRKGFLKSSLIAATGVIAAPKLFASGQSAKTCLNEMKIGLIGLDTSHSTAFVELLNNENKPDHFKGFRIVSAYPYGSRDIKTSYERIPSYIKTVKAKGVDIADSIADVLKRSDVVLLETNDGKPRLQQTLEILKAGKKVFIDKPVAAQFKDVVKIFDTASKLKVPIFSSSALRYTKTIDQIISGEAIGKVTGADMFTPGPTQSGHMDMGWYGIHGIEPLFAVMGKGCKELTRTYTENTDVIIAKWHDGRIGTIRAIRKNADGYGGTVYGEKGIKATGGYDGYQGLLLKILDFFKTGTPPVSPSETLEIYAFIEACDESRRRGGKTVLLSDILSKYNITL